MRKFNGLLLVSDFDDTLYGSDFHAQSLFTFDRIISLDE